MGATLAYINGGDPLSGGSSAVAAEKAAQYLAEQYNDGTTAIDPQTGEFTPNLLPEAVKEEITAITGAIAGVVGATGNNGAALNAQIGSVIGQNAVVNNDLVLPAPIPLPVSIPKTPEQKEAEKLLAIAVENGMKTVVTVVDSGNGALWGGIFCVVDPNCDHPLATAQDIWHEHMGDADKTPATHIKQTSAGSPQIEPPDDKNKNNSKSSGSQAKKMSDKQIQELTGNKNWHQTNLKHKIIARYRKELRGSSNFDFYRDPKTKEIFIQGNKSQSRLKINLDEFL